MAWNNLSFAFGSLLTASKMTSLYDDIAAAMNQDSGAPAPGTNFISLASQLAPDVVGSSELKSGAVHQAELSASTGSVSTSSAGVNLTLPGGLYGFYPQIKKTSGLPTIMIGSGSGIPASYTTNIYLGTTAGTIYAKQKYVAASPPYDLGNGDIPAFVFCLVNKTTGEIEATYIAADPPWAHNGPTNIAPDLYDKKGNGYQMQRIMSWPKAEALADPVKRAENIQALIKPKYKKVLVTMKMKNADMPCVPHPFPEHDPSTHEIVLADPLSELAHAAGGLLDTGDIETVNEMLEGYVTLGNKPLSGLITPPGVIGVKATLR